MTTSISGTSGITFPNGSNQDVGAVGVGQTWQDVTASRALGTTYTNNTGKPIQVSATVSQPENSAFTFVINGLTIVYAVGFAATNISFLPIIPNGATYKINVSTGTPNLVSWMELR